MAEKPSPKRLRVGRSKRCAQGWDNPLIDPQLLGDDILVHILHFLGNGDDSGGNGRSVVRGTNNFGTLSRSAKLYWTLSLISHQFLRLCRSNRLADILGLQDATFAYRWSPSVTASVQLFLARNHIKLRSLNGNSLLDVNGLATLLRNCDTSRLTAMDARCYQLPSPSSAFASPHSLTMTAVRTAATDEKAVPDLIDGVRYFPAVRSEEQYQSLIDAECETLENLVLAVTATVGVDRTGTFNDCSRALFGKQTLRHLTIILRVTCDNVDSAPFSVDLSPLARRLPGLRELHVWTAPGVQDLCGARLSVASTSLRTINVDKAGRDVWIERCVCPSLERLECRGGHYVNGLHQLRDFSGTVQVPARSMNLEGIDVPENCLIVGLDPMDHHW